MNRRRFLKSIFGSLILIPVIPAIPAESIWRHLIKWVNSFRKKPVEFKRITIPLVRRIYPQLIANDIVSVQPMLQPTGLVYYLRHKYSNVKGLMSSEGCFTQRGCYAHQGLVQGRGLLALNSLANEYPSSCKNTEKSTVFKW